MDQPVGQVSNLRVVEYLGSTVRLGWTGVAGATLSLYHSIYLSLCHYIFIFLSFTLSLYHSIYHSVTLYIYLSIYHSIYLSIYHSITIYLYIYLSIFLHRGDR